MGKCCLSPLSVQRSCKGGLVAATDPKAELGSLSLGAQGVQLQRKIPIGNTRTPRFTSALMQKLAFKRPGDYFGSMRKLLLVSRFIVTARSRCSKLKRALLGCPEL